jgi:hypothetical protein
VNVWVLNHELKQMRAELGIDNVAPLPRAIINGWKPGSPVDCLVVSPELELLGRQPVNELLSFGSRSVEKYKEFLTASLDGKYPDLRAGPEAVPDGKNAPPQVALQRIAVEMLGDDKFRINGSEPLDRNQARRGAIALKAGKAFVVVVLRADPKKVSQEDFDAMAKVLHEDWKLFTDVPSSSFGTERMKTGYKPNL